MHNKRPLVTSLAVSFKKAVITEDTTEAKKEHRRGLRTLIDQYFDDIDKGKAMGIRTAKELVEVIKADLLLMGEATERKEETTALEEARITRLTQTLDMNDPAVIDLISKMMGDLNTANDESDTNVGSAKFEQTQSPVEDEEEVEEEVE